MRDFEGLFLETTLGPTKGDTMSLEYSSYRDNLMFRGSPFCVYVRGTIP